MPIDCGPRSKPPRLDEPEPASGGLYIAVGIAPGDLDRMAETLARLPAIGEREAREMVAGIQRELAAAEDRARLGALPPPTCPVLAPTDPDPDTDGGDRA